MTTIISGVYGGYDKPKVPIPQSIPVDYVMVTDDPKLRAPGWEIVFDGCRRADTHPRLAAKWPKLNPWEIAPDNGPWIWVDGHIQIESRHFAEQALSAVDCLGMWEHPDRGCLFDEARFAASLPKYVNTPMLEQARHYEAMGHPADWGLWAAGVIVYKFELPHLASDWMIEIEKWGTEDQVSLDQVSLAFVLRQLQMRPDPLPYGLRDNPWMRINPHRDGTS